MIIQSTRVYLEELWVSAQLEIENGKIVTIWPYNTKAVDKDYGDHRILPGFIDTHCHGTEAQHFLQLLPVLIPDRNFESDQDRPLSCITKQG